MKVLLVTGSYPPMKCGVGDYTAQLAGALAEIAGVEVEVLTTGERREIERVEGVTIRRFMIDWSLLRWRQLIAMVREVDPDCIHVQYPTQGYASGGLQAFIPIIARVLGVPVVQTWHEGFTIRSFADFLLRVIVCGPLIVVRPNFKERNLPALFRGLLGRRALNFIPSASALPRVEISDSLRISIKAEILQGQRYLIVFFGFVFPSKGADLLFEIANPQADFILIVGEVMDEPTRKAIEAQLESITWRGKSIACGFVPMDEAATLLALADAVVLPFRTGGGGWNTSIHAAAIQGTFVLTTALEPLGYSSRENIYRAKIDDIQEMKRALREHVGTRVPVNAPTPWAEIARKHVELYKCANA